MKLSFELRRCSEQALSQIPWPGTVPWKWESLNRLKPFSSDFNNDFNAETLWGSQASSVPAPGAAEIPKTGTEPLSHWVLRCFRHLPVRRGWTLAVRMEIPEALTLNLTQSMNSLKKNSAGMDEPRKLKCGWAGAFGWNYSKSWFMSSNKLVEWPGQRWDGSIWDEARRGFLQHRHQHLCKIWSSSRGQWLASGKCAHYV